MIRAVPAARCGGTRRKSVARTFLLLPPRGAGLAFERHDGISQRIGGFLKCRPRLIDEQESLVKVSGSQQVGDLEHVRVEGRVEFKRGAILRQAAKVFGVGGEQPLVNGALLGMGEAAGGTLAERLAHLGGEQQGNLPADVAGDGVLRGENGLRDVGGVAQRLALSLATDALSDGRAEKLRVVTG